jgi:peptidoglycan biosynthesis protein MviN/MurJ (putative lipid II flippase)
MSTLTLVLVLWVALSAALYVVTTIKVTKYLRTKGHDSLMSKKLGILWPYLLLLFLFDPKAFKKIFHDQSRG